MQEQHDLPDDLLLGPAGDDPCRPFAADPRHLLQPIRLLFDQIEHVGAESPDQALGVDRADAADQPRRQIALDALQRGRCTGLEEGRPELLAMGAVVDPAAARLDELAGGDHCYPPDDGDQVLLAARLDTQHAKSVLRIVEGHPFHCARQDFR